MRSAVAALLAVTIVGCSAPAAVVPTAVPSPLTSTATPAATVVPTATAVPTPTIAPTPTPTPIIELSQVIRPLTNGWRPAGPTLLFATSEGDGTQALIAVPFGPNGRTAEPTRLLTFTAEGWDVRSDGGALVVAVRTSSGVRLATWDIASGTGRWITPSGPDAFVYSPVWSKDGFSIFFASSEPGALLRIGADGQGIATAARLDRFGGPLEVTPDGRGVIWSKGQEGGSAEIFDLASGTNKHLDDVARVVSWRAQQPRILLMVGGCCAGRPGGSLVAVDDVAMTSRVIAGIAPDGSTAFGAGAWDPTGTRIAAWRYDELTARDASLVIIDAGTGTIRPISDVLGIGVVLWLDEGIIVTRALARSPTSDVVLVPPEGGPSIALYQGAGIGRLIVVRP